MRRALVGVAQLMFLRKLDAQSHRFFVGEDEVVCLSTGSDVGEHAGTDGIEISARGGGTQGVECEHLPALLTNLLQKQEEWQERTTRKLQHKRHTFETILFRAALVASEHRVLHCAMTRCTRRQFWWSVEVVAAAFSRTNLNICGSRCARAMQLPFQLFNVVCLWCSE